MECGSVVLCSGSFTFILLSNAAQVRVTSTTAWVGLARTIHDHFGNEIIIWQEKKTAEYSAACCRSNNVLGGECNRMSVGTV